MGSGGGSRAQPTSRSDPTSRSRRYSLGPRTRIRSSRYFPSLSLSIESRVLLRIWELWNTKKEEDDGRRQLFIRHGERDGLCAVGLLSNIQSEPSSYSISHRKRIGQLWTDPKKKKKIGADQYTQKFDLYIQKLKRVANVNHNTIFFFFFLFSEI